MLLASACQPKTKSPAVEKTNPHHHLSAMQSTLIRQQLLLNLPSASGLEVIGDKLFIIGDDSPLLYQLQVNTWDLTTTYSLLKTEDFITGRIPKSLKPDLECLTSFTFNNTTYLLAFGSGSTSKRDMAYLVPLADASETPPVVQEISLRNLYQVLQADTTITTGGSLNLEAAATSSEHLYLLQRSINNGPDVLLTFSLPAFITYLLQPTGNLPNYTVVPLQLPQINGYKAGFSGASFFDDKLFITASVENTNDAYLDGEVLGSFAGYIPMNQASDPTLYTARLTDTTGQFYLGKVESVRILQKIENNQYRALAVTDNDDGQSELLELVLTLP
ncbi:DUF6929 family protein [Adhaeribacter radiodurans]|uniref:DUF4394 domain-containing protein n=1 Tax=Adhaeribacter radiodurans TaxID=2745197 RepID=A0A7L7LD97_9BACT|nr:hypothetical protein [Adhaeribacter radiodurans]QMU30753.1 hypothetical protein HUW48_23195 [Adhaeribacter radiodurans]